MWKALFSSARVQPLSDEDDDDTLSTSSSGEDSMVDMACLTKGSTVLVNGRTSRTSFDEAEAVIMLECLISVQDMSYKDMYDRYILLVDLDHVARSIPQQQAVEFLEMYSIKNPLVRTMQHLLFQESRRDVLSWSLEHFMEEAHRAMAAADGMAAFGQQCIEWRKERDEDVEFQEELMKALVQS